MMAYMPDTLQVLEGARANMAGWLDRPVFHCPRCLHFLHSGTFWCQYCSASLLFEGTNSCEIPKIVDEGWMSQAGDMRLAHFEAKKSTPVDASPSPTTAAPEDPQPVATSGVMAAAMLDSGERAARLAVFGATRGKSVRSHFWNDAKSCLLYTSDAADE